MVSGTLNVGWLRAGYVDSLSLVADELGVNTLERRVPVRLGLLDTVAVSLPALVLWGLRRRGDDV